MEMTLPPSLGAVALPALGHTDTSITMDICTQIDMDALALAMSALDHCFAGDPRKL